MNGRFDDGIIKAFKDRFEKNCISLLLSGYGSLKSSGRDFTCSDENDITAQLIGFMKKNPLAADLHISISREGYLDSEDTYAGKVRADKSPRMDIRYITWGAGEEYGYWMEAKNLAQNNWTKPGRKTPVDALALQKRYIATGIDHFVKGTYGNGCLLAYILEGNVPQIVDAINRILDTGRREEWLARQNDHEFDNQYRSNHGTIPQPLKHFFLQFCN